MNHDPSPRQPGNNTPRPCLQISLEELQGHVVNQLCFFCHLLGHLSHQFPRCTTQNDASVVAINTSSQSYPAILIKILQEEQCIEVVVNTAIHHVSILPSVGHFEDKSLAFAFASQN
ncbi:hypothetical protein DSO57_1015465 [Entomophthora muscae]|uniref:Uncharacterized protein n=1 Tax=Entomophthora muscae TaxID=34485 RepID=A0ACC2SU76_9FUNG|nr:hypothetical protein DSO57_1015465 [Entomophthora muscae]